MTVQLKQNHYARGHERFALTCFFDFVNGGRVYEGQDPPLTTISTIKSVQCSSFSESPV